MEKDHLIKFGDEQKKELMVASLVEFASMMADHSPLFPAKALSIFLMLTQNWRMKNLFVYFKNNFFSILRNNNKRPHFAKDLLPSRTIIGNKIINELQSKEEELVQKNTNQLSPAVANIFRKKGLFIAYLKVFSPIEVPLKKLEVI